MPPAIDLTGKRFGRWTVIQRDGSKLYPSGSHQPLYLCQCDCGTKKHVVASILRDGTSKSCGCLNAEIRSKICTRRNTKHGACGTKTYVTWRNMVSRCHSPSSSGNSKYGARGIHVCERWHAFENFLHDMGECPDGYSIERENNFLGYQPGNCSWIPLSKQQKNKRSSAIHTRDDLLNVIRNFCVATGETPESLLASLHS